MEFKAGSASRKPRRLGRVHVEVGERHAVGKQQQYLDGDARRTGQRSDGDQPGVAAGSRLGFTWLTKSQTRLSWSIPLLFAPTAVAPSAVAPSTVAASAVATSGVGVPAPAAG